MLPSQGLVPAQFGSYNKNRSYYQAILIQSLPLQKTNQWIRLMEQTKKSRIAEWSMLAGLIVGLLVGLLLGEKFFAEPLAGAIVGGGFGLVIAAFVCGLRG